MPPKPRSAKEWGELTARVSALLAIIISCGVLYKEHFLSPKDLRLLEYRQDDNERRILANEETLKLLTDINVTLVLLNHRVSNIETNLRKLNDENNQHNLNHR